MQTKLDPRTQRVFDGEISKLHDEFRGIFGAETIERYVSESIDRMEGPGCSTSCRSSSTASPGSGSGPWPSRRTS